MTADAPAIRPYQADDLDTVVSLRHRSWSAALPDLVHLQPIGQWRDRFREEIVPGETVWVAEMDGRIVGFIALDEASGYLDQMFVEPEAQSRGIGRALTTWAKNRCPAGLRLHTLAQNTRARSLYESHGFHVVAKGVNAVNGQPNVEYVWHPAEC